MPARALLHGFHVVFCLAGEPREGFAVVRHGKGAIVGIALARFPNRTAKQVEISEYRRLFVTINRERKLGTELPTVRLLDLQHHGIAARVWLRRICCSCADVAALKSEEFELDFKMARPGIRLVELETLHFERHDHDRLVRNARTCP